MSFRDLERVARVPNSAAQLKPGPKAEAVPDAPSTPLEAPAEAPSPAEAPLG